MIELYIGGQAVDTAPNTKITLNFNSNVFGDISKIQPSNSLTISLPKTPTNSKVFGVPGVVGGSSIAPYRRWNAELYVNGVAMVDTAYAVLLSVGDSYEIALYWGVVTALSTLKDSGKTLADINEVLEIKYGGENWWQSWEAKNGTDANGNASWALRNASYETGIGDLRNNTEARMQYALLPSVNAKWVWDNIIADNGLQLEIPAQYANAIRNMAIPFTTHKTSGGDVANVQFTKADKTTSLDFEDFCATIHTPITDFTSAFYTIVNGTIKLKVGDFNRNFDSAIFVANAELKSVSFALYIEYTENDKKYPFYRRLNVGIYKNDQLIGESSHYGTPRKIVCSATTDMNANDRVYVVIRAFSMTGIKVDDISFISVKMVVSESAEIKDQAMGGMINTRDNLPDISQLDFVKAICAMYGLWATLIDGKVYLIPYSDLYVRDALDWSRKLVGTGDYDAERTSYALTDYAQRNILKYKNDDTVVVDASGALVVDNETLDKEKEMVSLPFAASDGNVIPHIVWKDEAHTEVEEQKVEPRIMQLNEGSNYAKIEFGNIGFAQLIKAYYSEWQKIMRTPIVIEEKVQLSEIDIKTLDFRKPIYLQKYGAQFVVDKVQWSEGEPSTVTLVKLPPAKDIGVALPYKVTTGVTFGTPMSLGTNDPNPSWAYLVSGAGDYFADKATLSFDEATAKSKHGIAFVAWTTEAGRVLSTDNPFVYDGSNGDMVIYANTADTLS